MRDESDPARRDRDLVPVGTSSALGLNAGPRLTTQPDGGAKRLADDSLAVVAPSQAVAGDAHTAGSGAQPPASSPAYRSPSGNGAWSRSPVPLSAARSPSAAPTRARLLHTSSPTRACERRLAGDGVAGAAFALAPSRTRREPPITGLRRPKTEFDRAATMQSEGMSKAAIARVLGVSAQHDLSLAAKGGRASCRVPGSARLDRRPDRVPGPMSSHAAAAARPERPGAYSAVEVWSRMWVGVLVGNRTLRSTFLFARRLKAAFGTVRRPPIVVSDAFHYYEPVMRRVFAHTIVYLQVEKRYSKHGVVRSDVRRVIGTEGAQERAWGRSEDSRRPNTSYIERINLRKRMCCSMLRRRNPAPARNPQKIEQALELVRLFYNFVQRHSSLRFGKERRTPAMAGGDLHPTADDPRDLPLGAAAVGVQAVADGADAGERECVESRMKVSKQQQSTRHAPKTDVAGQVWRSEVFIEHDSAKAARFVADNTVP